MKNRKVDSTNLVYFKIDSNPEIFLKPFDSVIYNDFYVIAKEVSHSSRPGIKGWSSLIVSNYNYSLKPNEVICYDSDFGSTDDSKIQGTTIGLDGSLAHIIYKIDSCLTNSSLIEYSCNPDDESVESHNVSCTSGCFEGICY